MSVVTAKRTDGEWKFVLGDFECKDKLIPLFVPSWKRSQHDFAYVTRVNSSDTDQKQDNDSCTEQKLASETMNGKNRTKSLDLVTVVLAIDKSEQENYSNHHANIYLVLGDEHENEGIPSKRSCMHAFVLYLRAEGSLIDFYLSIDDDILAEALLPSNEKIDLLTHMLDVATELISKAGVLFILHPNRQISATEKRIFIPPGSCRESCCWCKHLNTKATDGNLFPGPLILNEAAIIVNTKKTSKQDFMTVDMKNMTIEDWKNARDLYDSGDEKVKHLFYHEGHTFTTGLKSCFSTTVRLQQQPWYSVAQSQFEIDIIKRDNDEILQHESDIGSIL